MSAIIEEILVRSIIATALKRVKLIQTESNVRTESAVSCTANELAIVHRG